MTGLGTIPSVSSSGSLMTNYARIGHAAQQIFPEILQDIIAIKESQHRLYSDVTSNRYLNRNLRADEWSMINNVRTNGYVNFDIPLIYKLVRNLNLIPAPSKGWDFHTPPAANEILPGDDIERIRRTRNEILHRGNAQVSDLNLTDYFTAFKDIAIRLEIFLGKPRREFLHKFQDLETCCMDEDTEKTYLDRLAILREPDTNLSEAVANMRKDLDTFMNKESHQIVIEEWEEQNKLFIKTDAVDFVLESLTNNNCCTVIGTSGIGKSATIHHVALFLRDTEGYRIIPIHSPSDIEKYFQRNWRQIFVIDDICGKYTVIQTEVEKWIKRNESIQRVLTCNNIKVIASCRIQVFNENQFKRLKLFTANRCNLSSDTFYLSSQVKLQIARQYLPERAVEHIKNDLDKYEFLPLMFALYKSLCKGNMGKEHFDVVKFFKNPFNIYTEEINALYELLDKTKFCALFFLVIYNGCLDVDVLQKAESEQERKTREDFFEDCGIPRQTLRHRIQEQLESLVPLFVRSNYDILRQLISFSAIHDKTFDFFCFYYGNKFQKSFLRFANSKILYERTMLKSLVTRNENIDEFAILIDDIYEDEYFNRIEDEWSSGKLATLFYSRQMKCKKYRNKLIEFLNRLPEEKRRELVTINTEENESLHLSPLRLASERNFSDLIKYILNFINDTTGEAFSNLFIDACSSGLTNVVNIFIHKGFNIHATDTNGCTALVTACDEDHQNIVKLLLNFEVDVNVSNEMGQTPLILSCEHNNSEIAQLLIGKGADVNAFDFNGITPLIWSCLYSNTFIAKLLIKKGANVNVSDESGDTPLIFSCCNNNSDIVRFLIENRANVNVANKKGKTPLIISCENDHCDIIRLLIKNGSDVKKSDNFGKTPLIWSYENNNTDIVRLLIEEGSDVNVVNESGQTPLIWSCEHNKSDIIRLLIEKGAEVNVSDDFGETPLISACNNDNSDIIRFLIEKGANVNVALIWSCENNNSDIVRLLLQKGAKINLRDFDGMTALLYASKNGFFEIVEELIMNGADILLADKNGKTPLIYANENEDRRIENFLSKHLYRLCIFDRKRKISEHQSDSEVIYKREAKLLKIDNDVH